MDPFQKIKFRYNESLHQIKSIKNPFRKIFPLFYLHRYFFPFSSFFFIQHLPREYQRYQFNKSSNKFQLLSRKKIITQQKIYHSVYPHSDKLPTSSSPSLFVTFNKNIIARERNAAKQTYGISCIRINTYEIPCILDQRRKKNNWRAPEILWWELLASSTNANTRFLHVYTRVYVQNDRY